MNNPQSIIADVAERYIGVKETSRNDSPKIREFWKSTNYPKGAIDRQPWCAAFTAHCVAVANRESSLLNLRSLPNSASVLGWIQWASKPENGCRVFEWTKKSVVMTPQRGDIVTFEWRTGHHIGIVGSEPYTRQETGNSYIKTIEGNTGSAGGRDGDGVFYKERQRDICHLFIRLPSIPKANIV